MKIIIVIFNCLIVISNKLFSCTAVLIISSELCQVRKAIIFRGKLVPLLYWDPLLRSPTRVVLTNRRKIFTSIVYILHFYTKLRHLERTLNMYGLLSVHVHVSYPFLPAGKD